MKVGMVMASAKVTKEAFIKYVDAGHDLAENIKRCIQKDGCIDNKTIIALNEFTIASNNIKDLTDELNESDPNKH